MKLAKRIVSFCLIFAMMLTVIPFALMETEGVFKADAIAGGGPPSATNPEMVLGVDLSYWNVDGDSLNYSLVNFQKLKDSGCKFVILRIGYETSTTSSITTDKAFLRFYEEARKVGMPLGLYFYSYALTYDAAAADANWVISMIEKYDMYFEYPIYLDMETDAQTGSSSSTATKNNICLGWCETLEAKGYYPGIYSAYWVYDVLYDSVKSKYDFWVPAYKSLDPYSSQYTYNSSVSFLGGNPYSNGYCMWQYSCCNTYNGNFIYDGVYSSGTNLDTSLDLNVCYKDYPSIMAQYGYNNCGPKVDKSALKTALDTAEAVSYTKYSEKQMRTVRYAYYNAYEVYYKTSATQDEVDSAATALNNALNVSGFNEGGIRVNGINGYIEDGDCFIYTSGFGEISVSTANIAYTLNAVCAWDNARQAWYIKEKFQGNGTSTPSVKLTDDEFMIACHYSTAIKDSQTSHGILSNASVGDVLSFHGVTLGQYPGVSVGAYIRVEAPTSQNLVSGKNYTVSGDMAIVNNAGYGASLTDGVASSDVVTVVNNWFAFNTAANSNTADGKGYVIFDLGKKYDVSKVKVHLANIYEYGVSSPDKITLAVSNDGVNFAEYANSLPIKEGNGDENTYINELAYWSELSNLKLTGRYLKVSVSVVGTWAFLNEIEVYGTENTNTDTDTHTCVAGDWEIVKDATATEDGLKQKTCTTCGKVLETEVIPATGEEPEYVLGDVDCNGEVTATDYLILKRIIFGSMKVESLKEQSTAFARCDVSGDGKISAVDYLALKRIIFA